MFRCQINKTALDGAIASSVTKSPDASLDWWDDDIDTAGAIDVAAKDYNDWRIWQSFQKSEMNFWMRLLQTFKNARQTFEWGCWTHQKALKGIEKVKSVEKEEMNLVKLPLAACCQWLKTCDGIDGISFQHDGAIYVWNEAITDGDVVQQCSLAQPT